MATASTIRAASPHCRLALTATHCFSPTLSGPAKKARFPEDVDVLLAPELVFTLAGVLDGSTIDAAAILVSQLAKHLVDYLQANASELGIALVSNMYLDTDGLPKFKVASSRCLTPVAEFPRVHVILVGIHLKYAWRTCNSDNSPSTLTSDSLINPFSTHLALPFRLLLDNVINRFCTWQLVRRYPLIFGPWSQQLDIERPYFKKLFSSISSTIIRSQNQPFRKSCARILKTMQDQHNENFTLAFSSLASYFGSSANFYERDEGALRTDPQSDDDELSQDQSLVTPESSQNFDESYLWHNPPDPVITNTDADIELDFDLPRVSLALLDANIDRCSILDKNFSMEYQDPFDFWRDEADGGDKDDFLSLSSEGEEESPFGTATSSLMPGTVTPGSSYPSPVHLRCSDELELDWDVIMDDTPYKGHAERSPDARHTRPTQVKGAAANEAEADLLRPGTSEAAFSGLSTKQCQEDEMDLELTFDSDEEAHDVEEFEGMFYGCELRGEMKTSVSLEELEHQAGRSVGGVGAGMGDFCAGLLDEDW
ncbi:hypothetical protein GGX14DRAFT_462247, partial [Mycena pura]